MTEKIMYKVEVAQRKEALVAWEVELVVEN